MAAEEGVVRVGEIYTLAEFQRRMDMGEWAYRKATRSGLRVVRKHGKVFVRGSDWLDYCNLEASQQPKVASA